MPTPKNELYIITCAKKLVDYIFDINDRAPKKYRYSIITKVDNECLDLIKKLYLANSYRVNDIRRKDTQREIKVCLSTIDYLFHCGVIRQCYTSHQYMTMGKLLNDCLTYLEKWIMSDANRIK